MFINGFVFKKRVLKLVLASLTCFLIVFNYTIQTPISLNGKIVPKQPEINLIQEQGVLAQTDQQEANSNEQNQEENTRDNKSLLDSQQVLYILIGLILFALIVIIYVFSPVIKTEELHFQDKAEFINIVLPRTVEGVTVTLIVIVVTLLSLAEKIQPEGAISILSALVGYVLGKQQGSREALENTPPPGSSGGGGGKQTSDNESNGKQDQTPDAKKDQTPDAKKNE